MIVRELYDHISEEDISHPLQDLSSLERKAARDARLIIEAISRRPRPVCLEIGPGLGHLKEQLGDKVEYFAADVSPNYLRTVDLKQGHGLLWDVTSGGVRQQFDLVIACDVFEHVLNEGDAWLSVFEALKPEGLFFLRVPAGEPLINYSRLLGAPYRFVHLRTYSQSYIKLMASMAGFRVKRMKGYFEPIPWAQRYFFSPKQKSRMSRNHTSALRAAFEGSSEFSSSESLEGSVNSSLCLRQRLFSAMPTTLKPLTVKIFTKLRSMFARFTHHPYEICIVLEKPGLISIGD